LEGVVDVDAIPSPVIEPVSPTVIKEHEPMTEKMDVDLRTEETKPYYCTKPYTTTWFRSTTTVEWGR
jgi:hypothetical protein